MRGETIAWVEARRPAPPSELHSYISEAIRAVPEECLRSTVADTLAAASKHVLDNALREPADSRKAGMQLLVADSLVTYALEAQSEAAAFSHLAPFAADISTSAPHH